MTDLRRHLAACALLACLVAVAYSGALRNGFVWDDNFQILRNPYLHSNQGWYDLWTSDVWGYTRPGTPGVSNYYRPLQMLTYGLTAELGGLTPENFHAVNLLFHLLATLAAYALAWELLRKFASAIAAGALFALHPMHTEAVAWVSALTELGCALFFFLSFWLFLLADHTASSPAAQHHRRHLIPKQRRWRRGLLLGGSCACFLLALLWKEMALSLPLVICAYTIFNSRRRSLGAQLLDALRVSLPYWAVTSAYLILRLRVLGFFSRVQHPWALSPDEYLVNVVGLIARYWFSLLLPLKLNAFHQFVPLHSWLETRALVSATFVLLAGGLILYGRHRAPLPSFAAVWVFLTLVPVLNLRGVGANVFAERYLYIPSLGFCLLAVWLAATIFGSLRYSRWTGATALAVISAFYLAETVRRVPDWRNEFIFYSRSVEASPNSPLMHNSLGQILREEKGDLDGAERQYSLAIAAAKEADPPDDVQIANAYVGLSGIYVQQGRYERALEAIRRGLAVDNSVPSLHVAEGVVLINLGRMEEARAVLVEANASAPNDEVVLNALGVIALSRKEHETAIGFFEKAIKVLPSYPDALNNLGRTLSEVGRDQEALPNLQRAVDLAPNNPVFHTNLGVVLGRLRRFPEARAELERALALAPAYQPALANLSRLEQLEDKSRREPR